MPDTSDWFRLILIRHIFIMRVFFLVIFVVLIGIMPVVAWRFQNDQPQTRKLSVRGNPVQATPSLPPLLNSNDPADFGRLKFQSFTEKDGLSDIHVIAFDQKKYLWVGTVNGPAYYNGRTWTFVEIPNKKQSNWVRALLTATDGSLWFGTEAGGLSHLHNEKWTLYTTGSGLPNNGVRTLLETTSEKRTPILWVGTFGGGLARLENNQWTTWDPSNGFPSKYVYKLLETISSDGKRVLWAGTGNGLAQCVDGKWVVFDSQNSPLPSNSVLSLLETTSSNGKKILWVGTEKGLAAYSEGEWTLFNSASSPSHIAVLSLLETISPDGGHALWVGTQGSGLFRLENGQWRVFDSRSGLINNLVVSLAQTTNDQGITHTLWVGASRGGLSRMILGGWITFDLQNGLPNNQVYRFCETTGPHHSTVYWVATYGGLARFENGVWSVFNTQNSPLPSNIVETLLETTKPDGTRSLWVGFFQSNSGGVLRIEKDQWTIFNTVSGLPDNRITRLLETKGEDGHPILWVATYGGGIGRFENNVWTTLDTSSGLPDNRVQALLQTISPDGSPILWVGTFGGLGKLEKGKWTVYDTSSGLPNNGVLDILETKADDGTPSLWIATNGGGAVRFDYATPHPQWLVFSESTQPELAHNIVFQAQKDQKNRIYLMTNRGITRLTPLTSHPLKTSDFSAYTFTTEDGLPSSICNFGASMVDKRGRIWVGTVNGAAMFDWTKEIEGTRPMPLYLERTFVNEVEKHLVEGTPLAYNQNHLTFEFALLNYFRESDIRYKTQLIGLDEQPSDWFPDPKKEYTNLNEGRYTFQVWAKNHAGIVSGPVEFHFEIRPAPWRTWWAYLLYAVVIVLIASGGIHLRFKTLESRTRILEHKIRERTAELAEKVQLLEASEKRALYASSAKSTFLANMSHELRTPLNAILGFAQLMERESKRTFDDYERLEIIIRSGEHLLGLINDVLSISKIEAGKLILNDDAFDLHRMLGNLEGMFRLRAKNKGLNLAFTASPNLPQFVRGDDGRLRQVLINLIGNALKFTDTGQVVVHVTSEGEWFTFEIEDTGYGIGPEEIEKLFEPFAQTQSGLKTREGTGLGLAISREFVRMMGGDIEVHSQLGQGSIFKFKVQLGLEKEFLEIEKSTKVIGVAPNQAQYRILVVDDQPENRKTLSELMETVGLEVRAATNGKEAVEIWSAWHPHLIWMDMRMPVMDGYEATRQIRAEEIRVRKEENRLETSNSQFSNPNSHCIIIALSAGVFEQDRNTILEIGCDDFVSKPYRESALFEIISKHLGIEFQIEGEVPSKSSVEPEPSEEEILSPTRLHSLPSNWVGDFVQALNEGDLDAANRIVDLISPDDEPLALKLKGMIKAYRVDEILLMFEKI